MAAKFASFLVATALLAPPAGSAASGEQAPPAAKAGAYDVEMVVARDGREVLSPRLRLLPGKPGSVSVGMPGHADGDVRIEVVANPGASVSGGADTIHVAMTISEMAGGNWVLVDRPAALLHEGREAFLSVGGRDGGGYSLRLKAATVPPPG